ncbi:MAG: sigma-70 family RNA polymerase sigma factor [Lachnospiraceae bacterium]|nr:sigma-70 family RNA polymerase sigma factor [Lachnospiraceae bacterium]
MDDLIIIELYLERDEEAVRRTAEKYSPMIIRTAENVLGDREKAEETENDVYLRVWNSIPPARPKVFSAWLRKVARRLAIDRLRRDSREKRGGTEYDAALDEIGEICSGETPDEAVSAKLLSEAIVRWIRELSEEKRRIFLRRYFDCESTASIAREYGKSETAVRTMLSRMRDDLRSTLVREGYDL